MESATPVTTVSVTAVPSTNALKMMAKPDKSVHDVKVLGLNREIDVLQGRLKTIRAKMDAIQLEQQNDKKNGIFAEKMKVLKDKLAVMKTEKDLVMATRNELSMQIKALKSQNDASKESQKAMKSQLKYSSLAEIEEALARLAYDQSTQNMTLIEEKKLIKEMEALSASKKIAKKFYSEQSSVDTFKGDIKSLRLAHDLKNADLDKASTEMDAVYKELNVLHDAKNNAVDRSQFAECAEERKALKPELDELYNSLRSIRTDFKEKNDLYFNHIRAVREAKKEELKVEEAKQKVEYEAKLAVYESEMSKIHVHQDEIDLCGALIKYLNATYAKELDTTEKAATKVEETACDLNIAMDGMVPMKRKEEDYMNFGGKKKKNGGNGKKKVKKFAVITLPLAHLDTYGKLGLLPPSAVDGVAASVQQIEDKLAYFSKTTVKETSTKATKGSSPKAKKTNASSENNGKKNVSKTSKKNYNAQTADGFPSLGNDAINASDLANWGPGSAPPAAAASVEFTPEIINTAEPVSAEVAVQE